MQIAAFQNGYYTALCNRVGTEDRLTFSGESFICAPDGSILARAPHGEPHVLIADLDFEAARRSYGRRLFRRDRRPELYSAWLTREDAG